VTATLITHVTGEDCQDQHGDEKMMSVSAYFYLYLSVLISSIWGLLLWFELSLSVLTFLSLLHHTMYSGQYSRSKYISLDISLDRTTRD